jgi:hypothetical protein
MPAKKAKKVVSKPAAKPQQRSMRAYVASRRVTKGY